MCICHTKEARVIRLELICSGKRKVSISKYPYHIEGVDNSMHRRVLFSASKSLYMSTFIHRET